MLYQEEKCLDRALKSVHCLRASTRAILESWASVHDSPQDIEMVNKLVEKTNQASAELQQSVQSLPQRISISEVTPGRITCSLVILA
jgi:hypothetical protein